MIECYNRTAYQFTWWEMYPTNDVQVVGQTAAAGDAITASVVRSGTSYKLTVTDSTHTADSFTTTQTCSASSCVDSSAEWIAEAPTGSSGVEPLSNFGTWTASNAAVTEGSTAGIISSFTDDEITMIDSSGATKALPGALNGAGTGFSVSLEEGQLAEEPTPGLRRSRTGGSGPETVRPPVCGEAAPGVRGVAPRCKTTRPPACAFRMQGASSSRSPDRIRTGVTALRGRRPRPLDDGALRVAGGSASPAS